MIDSEDEQLRSQYEEYERMLKTKNKHKKTDNRLKALLRIEGGSSQQAPGSPKSSGARRAGSSRKSRHSRGSKGSRKSGGHESVEKGSSLSIATPRLESEDEDGTDSVARGLIQSEHPRRSRFAKNDADDFDNGRKSGGSDASYQSRDRGRKYECMSVRSLRVAPNDRNRKQSSPFISLDEKSDLLDRPEELEGINLAEYSSKDGQVDMLLL